MNQAHKSPKTVAEGSALSYFQQRDALAVMCERRDRLAKVRAATQSSARSAGEQWRQQFRESLGEPSHEVRKLKQEEMGLRDEVEQIEDMLDEIHPAIEQARKTTAKARDAYLTVHRAERIEAASANLKTAVSQVLQTDAGKALAAAVAAKQHASLDEVLTSSGEMSSLGFTDAREAADPTFMARITTADQQQIQEKARKRTAQSLADALSTGIDQRGEEVDQPSVLPAAPSAPLACEKSA